MQKEEQRKRHDQWRIWIEEQAKSGLTQKTFCEQKGIDASQFSYYKAVFKHENNTSEKSIPTLVPIKLKEPPALSSDINMTLPNGVRFTFPSTIHPIHLKNLLEVFKTC